MLIFITILLVISIAMNIFLAINMFKLVDTIDDYGDKVSTSVFIIEQADAVVNELLQRPLLMDTPEVREILDHLKNVRKAIITIASTLGITVVIEEEDKDEKKKKR